MSEGNGPTSVYRYYDRLNMLIYVGITGRGMSRNVEHNKSKPWWQHVTRQEVEHFATRDEAHAREVDLIERHTPPFNVQHNRDHREMRALYEALVEGGMLRQDPVEMVRELKNRLPLTFVHRTVDELAVFRTLPAHAAVATRLVLPPDASVRLNSDEGAIVGRLQRVEVSGPFAIFTGHLRKSAEPTSVDAVVRQMAVKGPTTFGVRRVRVEFSEARRAA